MFKTFFNIIVSIATAPFSILAGTVMQGAGFGPWLKNMVSNLLVYPLVGAMLFLANYFLKIAASTTLLGEAGSLLFYFNPRIDGIIPTTGILNWSTGWWDPPLSNGFAVGSGGSIRGILLMGVSWTIISMIPKTAEMVKAFMAGKEIQTDMGGLFAIPKQAGLGYGMYAAQQLEQTAAPKPFGRLFGNMGKDTKRSVGAALEYILKGLH